MAELVEEDRRQDRQRHEQRRHRLRPEPHGPHHDGDGQPRIALRLLARAGVRFDDDRRWVGGGHVVFVLSCLGAEDRLHQCSRLSAGRGRRRAARRRRRHGGGRRRPRAITTSAEVACVPSHSSSVSASDIGDPGPVEAAVEERGDRHLVGGVEPGRSGPAGPAGRVGQVEAAEGRPVRRARSRASRAGSSRWRRTHGPAGRGRPGRSRSAGACPGSESWAMVEPSANVDHRVDDRLGVHDDLDAVVVDPEQLVRLDHLQALVHERRGVDRDLGPHGPGRMGQGLGDGHAAQLRQAAAPERPAAGGEHERGDAASAPPAAGRPQALVDGAVLGVDGDQLGPRRAPAAAGPRARPRSATPCWRGRGAGRPPRRPWSRRGRRSR